MIKTYSYMIEESVHSSIKIAAIEEGMSLSSLVEKLFMDYLKERQENGNKKAVSSKNNS